MTPLLWGLTIYAAVALPLAFRVGWVRSECLEGSNDPALDVFALLIAALWPVAAFLMMGEVAATFLSRRHPKKQRRGHSPARTLGMEE